MAETVVLDPSAVAINRTQLDITRFIDADGPDWGDAEIQAYLADQQVGSSQVDYRIPNRTIKIPFNLRAIGGTTYSNIKTQLQQKASLFQREGGQIMRKVGSTPLYADVQDAILHLGGSTQAAFRGLDVDAALTLTTLPDWYGDEVVLPVAYSSMAMSGIVWNLRNLVAEPDWSHVAVGQPPSVWSKATNSGISVAATSALVTNNSPGAAGACQITASSGSGAQGISIPLGFVAKGQTVTASVVLTSGKAGQFITVQLMDDVLLIGSVFTTPSFASNGLTQTINLSWTPGADQPHATLYCFINPTAVGETFIVRSAIVAPGSTASTWNDGDSSGWIWLGNPGQSQSGAPALVNGNYPGRCRIVVTDTSGNDQKGLLWAFRSRRYDSTVSAALMYEAETMTPLNGTVTSGAPSGASGTTMRNSTISNAFWTPMMSTTLATGSALLTHKGTYRVWARVQSGSAAGLLQLIWGIGSLSVPTTNDAVQIGSASTWYLVDLGVIRIDAPPIGANSWLGVIQASSGTVGSAIVMDIDQLFFQPLDEASGKLVYIPQTPASSIAVNKGAGAGADVTGVGVQTWNSPGNITAADGSYALAATTSQSHWLQATSFGFAIPSGATIVGIQLNILRYASTTVDHPSSDAAVRLVKGGVIGTTDRSAPGNWALSWVTAVYGGPTDLWGQTWAPADINASNFGAALSVNTNFPGGSEVDYMSITVYYTLASGFTVAQDAVVYASKSAEIRTEGAWRDAGVGTYGSESTVIGDLPRIPPSGLENRVIELFMKPTRGDFGSIADAGLDTFSVQVKYRPSYLYVGE